MSEHIAACDNEAAQRKLGSTLVTRVRNLLDLVVGSPTLRWKSRAQAVDTISEAMK